MNRSIIDGRYIFACAMGLKVLTILLFATCCGITPGARAASLEEKLATSTDYVPKANATMDQLVEVAQRFKIPMAVEWVERGSSHTPDKTLRIQQRSVKELIEAITSVSPEHMVQVEDGLVRVYSPVAAAHPFNFLNIRLDSYYVNDDDLFAAEDQLRWAIRFTLSPQKYRDGYAGGYGHGANDVFEFPKFSLSATDVTIREALNCIVKAQGNAMWTVTLKGAELEGQKPYWTGVDPDAGHQPVTSRWRFFPLSGINELAREQLAVDLTIDGLLDERIATIPVLTEHGLRGEEGGGAGMAYEDGSSISYGTRIEKVEQKGVTLSVELKVKRVGMAEQQFNEILSVTKGRRLEVWPTPLIRIRSYFEPRQ